MKAILNVYLRYIRGANFWPWRWSRVRQRTGYTVPPNAPSPYHSQHHNLLITRSNKSTRLTSIDVKDLRLKDKDKDLMSKDEDLKIGPRGSSRTRTFLLWWHNWNYK